MSTRSQIRFTEDGEAVAVIYRHSDGYPEGPGGVVADLGRFVTWLTGEPQPRPVHDLEYLAANWIYWNKHRLAEIHEGAEKLGIGVCPTTSDHVHGDCEYLYAFDGEILKVSEHMGFNDRPGNWDDVPWQFSGTLGEALERFSDQSK
jgi:hypothetical protein